MDFGILFQNRMFSVPFELEWVEFEIFIPGIPLPEKSQKECGLSFNWCLGGGGGSKAFFGLNFYQSIEI